MELLELIKGIDFTGMTEDQIAKAINDKAGELKAKVLIDDGKDNIYVPKARLDDEIGKKKAYKEQADNASKEMENIKKQVKDNEELVKQIDTFKEKSTDLEQKLQTQAIESAIKLKAVSAKAKDTTGADVLAFIDKGKLELVEDGTVKGLDEAFENLTKTKPYLFGEEDKGGTGNPGNPPANKGGKGGTNISIGEQLAKANSTGAKGAEDLRNEFFK